MASKTTIVTTKTYTDDITGEPLRASDRVCLKRIDGKYVWTVDVHRSTENSVTGADIKTHGTKTKLAGRPKGSAKATTTTEAATEASDDASGSDATAAADAA